MSNHIIVVAVNIAVDELPDYFLLLKWAGSYHINDVFVNILFHNAWNKIVAVTIKNMTQFDKAV